MARCELFIIFSRLMQKFTFVASPNHAKPTTKRFEGILTSPPLPFYTIAKKRNIGEYMCWFSLTVEINASKNITLSLYETPITIPVEALYLLLTSLLTSSSRLLQAGDAYGYVAKLRYFFVFDSHGTGTGSGWSVLPQNGDNLRSE